MAIHSPQGKSQLVPFHIGTLIASSSTASASESSEKTIDPIFLSKKSWKKVELVSIDQVSHDSSVYRFKLEKEDQALGLPIGHHVFVRLRRKDGEMVQRAYTYVRSPFSLSSLRPLTLITFFQTSQTHLPSLGNRLHRPPHQGLPPFDRLPAGRKDVCRLRSAPSWSVNRDQGTSRIVRYVFPADLSFLQPSFRDVLMLLLFYLIPEWIGDGHADWRGVKRKIRHVGMVCGGSGQSRAFLPST
jgi:hypothetical protein